MPHGGTRSEESGGGNGIARHRAESGYRTLAGAGPAFQRNEYSELRRLKRRPACFSATWPGGAYADGGVAEEGGVMDASTTPRPSFVYGTAWKKEATGTLVKTAVKAGFTAI